MNNLTMGGRYTDASIVRKGVEGDQGDGPFSTGVRSSLSPTAPDCDLTHSSEAEQATSDHPTQKPPARPTTKT
jgi:hypothetical protein